MEKLRFYDEAASNFYSGEKITCFPITSMDFYAQRFQKVCKSLHDVKNLSDLAEKEKWGGIIPFEDEILDKEHVVVVTDAELNIVYASQNITHMNGYRPDEILGKKPKMFQGDGTCKLTTQKVSEAIKKREAFEVVLTNYRKDGTAYQCWIKGSPVLNKTGKVVNFIAFEKEVA
ncbi:PAS domain-containing protein [Flagellimonas nanhaiensis]|uniref:PAS domain-containing protein n=1 Tax=Flagellimonas nanhaiensis TaxID=2292706 RepID=A0A371JQD4_9FLAO|nr:PAS domain-containing protein [Allomuricauda nanhaiensis]RDY59686.1 PAS domain-containing protein [Allomuricauda nanhaiensis]